MRSIEIAARVARASATPLRLVDLGGGLGIPYEDGEAPLDLRGLGAGLEALVADGLAIEARGRGLMCAIDLPRPAAAETVDALLAEGYLANNTTPHTLRFLPPLVVSDEQLDGLLAALRRVLPPLLEA